MPIYRANMYRPTAYNGVLPHLQPLCDCGEQQTMEHIVDLCPITQLDSGLLSLQEADVDAISRLKTTATKALTK